MNSKITTEFERLSVERILNLDSKYRKYWIISDRIEDEQQYIVVFSYIGKGENMYEQYVSQYRGFVIDIKNNVVIAKSYGITEQYQHNQFYHEYQNGILEKYRMYRAYEGVLLRVFKYKGQLYICTHRKLDFKLSMYRPGFTFKEMFDSFQGSDKMINIISDNLETNKSVYYLFMVHEKLAVADTNNKNFGIYFFCAQSLNNDKISYEFPDYLKDTILIQQNPISSSEAHNITNSKDVYDRDSASVLILKNDKPHIYMGHAFEFRKSILGEEQTLYPTFSKKVFELKTKIKNKAYDVYHMEKNENISYAEYMYEIYSKICPDSIKDLLKYDNKTLAEKYSNDYHETFDWIRKNPKSILDYCKEGRLSTTLAKMRMTQNFLTLEAFVEKNCTSEQFYSIVADAKKSKHMYEKHLQDSLQTNK